MDPILNLNYLKLYIEICIFFFKTKFLTFNRFGLSENGCRAVDWHLAEQFSLSHLKCIRLYRFCFVCQIVDFFRVELSSLARRNLVLISHHNDSFSSRTDSQLRMQGDGELTEIRATPCVPFSVAANSLPFSSRTFKHRDDKWSRFILVVNRGRW